MTVPSVVSRGPAVVMPPGLGALAPFVEAGVFGAYEVEFTAAVLRLEPGLGTPELLALAVAARAPRFGHVCMPIDSIAERLVELEGDGVEGLPWPPADAWAAALVGSPIVASGEPTGEGPIRPLVWDGGRLYLHRYWHYELFVADDLVRRGSATPPLAIRSSPVASERAVENVLDSLFAPERHGVPDLQRLAARRALAPGVSIIAGGPGTGKTFTVARLLVAAHLLAAEGGRQLSVALAAPTGKAAARMGEAVQEAVAGLGLTSGPGDVAELVAATEPTTIHTLLGWRDRTHFRHDRDHPLPEDLVIVDETSMVSLPLMAKLLGAVRPTASVVLVGDPYQLASIEAGTVMSDVVGPIGSPGDSPPAPSSAETPGDAVQLDLWGGDAGTVGPVLADRVTVLRATRRFGADSSIAVLADAVRGGDGRQALAALEAGAIDVRWVRPDDADRVAEVTDELVTQGAALATAAEQGDGAAALQAAVRVKVLAATRRGRNGMEEWTERIEQGVARRVPGFRPDRRWHVGRPILVTANDRINRVFNGDSGVVIEGDGGMEVVLASGDTLRRLAPSRLDRVDTWWAMTIHKSQGSEFSHVVAALPEPGSPILTRELLYTAVTRARDRLTVVGSAEAVQQAIARPLSRASGLRRRLWPG